MSVNITHSFDFDGLENHLIKAINESLYKVGVVMGDDSQTIPPKPPIKTGTLRASMDIVPDEENNSVRVSYHTAYAARWHETPFRPHGDPESGYKYLEKLIPLRAKYVRAFADFLREAL